ncbi:uncharacterized protein SCHCODRAFT_02508535 [Schizophyllum commune H4-8]|uniref:uncharacterized protein n=1 Tax=Schizophyllum commune (strain H4-8 / FGSC 9210) TaxID=578458 RepID=UPI00215EA216|nr:uncharacterized protein SCHCODRAFT_02508535 [Schizophyllum commune H4-8]KAI5890577.1 hypothetical protein SCHCODRAFT_02508535 [Schizophyllum commune H4-8]
MGLVHTTTAIPRGAYKILNHLHEGFANLPSLYGSSVRHQKKVTGIGTGVKEGGKALFWGVTDGISGLVLEPYEGAKKDGTVGALKGAARSVANLYMKPLAGMLGFVSLPLQGAWRSIESPRSQQQERQQRRLRVEEGEEAARHLSVSERQEIVYRYYVLKRDTHVRRQRLAALAEAKLKEDMQEGAMEDAVFADRTSGTTARSPGTSQASSCRSSISSSSTTTAPTSTRPSLMRSSASEPAVRHSESESELERRYQEDLSHAIRVSMSVSRPSETRSNTQ